MLAQDIANERHILRTTRPLTSPRRRRAKTAPIASSGWYSSVARTCPSAANARTSRVSSRVPTTDPRTARRFRTTSNMGVGKSPGAGRRARRYRRSGASRSPGGRPEERRPARKPGSAPVLDGARGSPRSSAPRRTRVRRRPSLLRPFLQSLSTVARHAVEPARAKSGVARWTVQRR
jgi:hypothetical protein